MAIQRIQTLIQIAADLAPSVDKNFGELDDRIGGIQTELTQSKRRTRDLNRELKLLRLSDASKDDIAEFRREITRSEIASDELEDELHDVRKSARDVASAGEEIDSVFGRINGTLLAVGASIGGIGLASIAIGSQVREEINDIFLEIRKDATEQFADPIQIATLVQVQRDVGLEPDAGTVSDLLGETARVRGQLASEQIRRQLESFYDPETYLPSEGFGSLQDEIAVLTDSQVRDQIASFQAQGRAPVQNLPATGREEFFTRYALDSSKFLDPTVDTLTAVIDLQRQLEDALKSGAVTHTEYVTASDEILGGSGERLQSLSALAGGIDNLEVLMEEASNKTLPKFYEQIEQNAIASRRLENSWGDLAVTIYAGGNASGYFSNRMADVLESVTETAHTMPLLADTVFFGEKAFLALGSALTGLAVIGQALPAISGMITLLKTQVTWTNLITAAQWAWNFALSANPIGLIVIGIVALIGVGLLLWKNWDTVTSFMSTAWDKVTDVVSNFWDKWGTWILVGLSAVAPFVGIPLLIIKEWDSITNFFEGMWLTIKGLFYSGVLFVLDTVRSGVESLNTILDPLGLGIDTSGFDRTIEQFRALKEETNFEMMLQARGIDRETYNRRRVESIEAQIPAGYENARPNTATVNQTNNFYGEPQESVADEILGVTTDGIYGNQ